MIHLDHVNHSYGTGALRRQVLSDVTATIQAGEIVLLTGPSGSGKTTLLSLIGALRSMQEGGLAVLGTQLRGASAQVLVGVRRQIGYIFQGHNLLDGLTALQNVHVPLLLHAAYDRRTARRRAMELLDAVGLSDVLHRYPAQLSGGQRQRVAIARALVARPRLILADEPTASLDGKAGAEVAERIRALAKREGCTAVVVTHDHRILGIADRVFTLEDGCLSVAQAPSPRARPAELSHQQAAA
jgi:putative ABC transport system ATP-binding protein